jgi:RimJ/RimL family protein N-acetyltransferase
MRAYFLKTERIGFSKWTKEDTALAMSLWGDPEVTRYICATGKFSKQDILKRLSLEMENDGRYSLQYWPIFSLADGEFLGCCGLRPHDMEKSIFELGYHLGSGHWGKGYATEAAGAVIHYAFDTLQASNLIAGHHPQNEGSGKVLAKLGFHRLGDAYYPPTGLYHAAYMYRLPGQ